MFHRFADQVELSEVLIMKAEPSGQLPDTFNGVKVWTVGWQVVEAEGWRMGLAPG